MLLDIISEFFPSPTWRKDLKGSVPGEENKEVEVKIDSQQPLCAQVFLTLFEPHLGEVSFIKVFSGSLSSGSSIYNATKGGEEKIGQKNKRWLLILDYTECLQIS